MTTATRAIFLHHSTGRNLLNRGGVRQLLAQQNQRMGAEIELWDHDYNEIGLSDGAGQKTGESYDIPDNNTDPDGLMVLFNQSVSFPATNALSHLLEFDVIIFKSCYPVCAIKNDTQLAHYRDYYREIRQTISRFPDKLFVAMTPPPLCPPLWGNYPWLSTNRDEARRARQFAEWLVSADFHGNLPNLVVFDYFDLLANPPHGRRHANMRKLRYRTRLGRDPHPNLLADRDVARYFVPFLGAAIEHFESPVSNLQLA